MSAADSSPGPPGRVIHASYAWTPERIAASQAAHLRSNVPPAARRAYKVLFVVCFVAGVLMLALRLAPMSAGVFLVVVGALPLFAFPALRRWAARRHWRSRADRDDKVDWQFSDEGIHTRTPSSTSMLHWPAIVRAVEQPDAVLLYLNSLMFLYLPREAFDPDDLDDFHALVRSKVARVDRR